MHQKRSENKRIVKLSIALFIFLFALNSYAQQPDKKGEDARPSIQNIDINVSKYAPDEINKYKDSPARPDHEKGQFKPIDPQSVPNGSNVFKDNGIRGGEPDNKFQSPNQVEIKTDKITSKP